MSVFGFLTKGLAKTRNALASRIGAMFGGRSSIDVNDLEELEDILLQADLGSSATEQVLKSLKSSMEKGEKASIQTLEHSISSIIISKMTAEVLVNSCSEKPHVIMVLGVNGTGKTTTAGKLAAMYGKKGSKVMLAAADTFRAAAIEQLEIWAKRTGADFIKHKEGADPSAVAFDAAAAAVSRSIDCLIVDTAGRLHTKSNLMEELKKVNRVLGLKIPGAPHEVLLVMDATTGQNGLFQAREFNKAVALTGIVLTKLDGTAKGGIVISVMDEIGVPVKYVGVGEGVDDLKEFDAAEFATGLFNS